MTDPVAMNPWAELFIQTLRTPEMAARRVLDVNLSQNDLWSALVAVAALNTVMTGVSLSIMPLPDGFPNFLSIPFTYFVIAVGGLILVAHIMSWTGRAMAGIGSFQAVLRLMIWLQFVRFVLQAATTLLLLALPGIGALASLGVTILSLWILLSFLKVGHALDTLFSAGLVLFATFVGLVVGLSLFLAIIGVSVPGGVPGV